jgi:transcriptional regulator with XRE-family HTH domain
MDEVAHRHFSGLKLYKARISRGLSREHLAVKVGCVVNSIYNWESGRGYPSADKLISLADALKLTTDYFYAGEK